jgi:hypothetical protein
MEWAGKEVPPTLAAAYDWLAISPAGWAQHAADSCVEAELYLCMIHLAFRFQMVQSLGKTGLVHNSEKSGHQGCKRGRGA